LLPACCEVHPALRSRPRLMGPAGRPQAVPESFTSEANVLRNLIKGAQDYHAGLVDQLRASAEQQAAAGAETAAAAEAELEEAVRAMWAAGSWLRRLAVRACCAGAAWLRAAHHMPCMLDSSVTDSRPPTHLSPHIMHTPSTTPCT
jgi:hypothetical protein